jgi:dienelactone hydrolase
MGLLVRLISFPSILVMVLMLAIPESGQCKQSVVGFQTEDGWKIQGTLFVPETAARFPIAGVILLSEPGGTERSIYDGYLAHKLVAKGIAALSVDMRGSGGSLGKKLFSQFSIDEMDGLQKDVRAAIEFLSSQKGIDPKRIGIVGAGVSANYAVLEGVRNSAVQALVMLSGRASPKARDEIRQRKDLPVLCVVAKRDQESFSEMAEAFAASKNPGSDLMLGTGHGVVIFTPTANLEDRVVGWIVDNLKGLGVETEVSFQSQDGWTLRGILQMPEEAADGAKLPGIVFVNGARHDELAFYNLAREAVKKKMVALRFDWRGKGRSINDGKWVFGVDPSELGSPEMEKVYVDVKAAINFLASQKQVNPNKIGIVAATYGCVQALQASAGDNRIRTLVLLSSQGPTDLAKQFLATSDASILGVGSEEDTHYDKTHSASGSFAEDTRHIYQLSKSKESMFLLFDGAGHGSEMFDKKPDLEPIILRWLAEKLAK